MPHTFQIPTGSYCWAKPGGSSRVAGVWRAESWCMVGMGVGGCFNQVFCKFTYRIDRVVRWTPGGSRVTNRHLKVRLNSRQSQGLSREQSVRLDVKQSNRRSTVVQIWLEIQAQSKSLMDYAVCQAWGNVKLF